MEGAGLKRSMAPVGSADARLLILGSLAAFGSLSATTPPPAWTYMTPSLNSAVRSTMQVSTEPSEPK